MKEVTLKNAHRRVSFYNLDVEKENIKSEKGALSRKHRKQRRQQRKMKSGKLSKFNIAKANGFVEYADTLQETFNVLMEPRNKAKLAKIDKVLHTNEKRVFEEGLQSLCLFPDDDVLRWYEKFLSYLSKFLNQIDGVRKNQCLVDKMKHLHSGNVYHNGNKIEKDADVMAPEMSWARPSLYLISNTPVFQMHFTPTKDDDDDGYSTVESSSDGGDRHEYQDHLIGTKVIDEITADTNLDDLVERDIAGYLGNGAEPKTNVGFVKELQDEYFEDI